MIRARWFVVGLAVAISVSLLAQSAVPSLPGGTLGAPASITPAFSGANNPTFTGQWTVNGSLCASGQVLQGGNPTTCTAAPQITRVLFGGSTASFPALRNTGATLEVRTADDTAYATLNAGNISCLTAGCAIQVVSGGSFGAGSSWFLTSTGMSGQLLVQNDAANSGVGLDLTTDGTLRIRNRAFSANGNLTAAVVTATTKVQPGSFAFASIGTTLTTNGDMAYCSDCTIANPCAGSGTGAIAKRLNGVNVCN